MDVDLLSAVTLPLVCCSCYSYEVQLRTSPEDTSTLPNSKRVRSVLVMGLFI